MNLTPLAPKLPPLPAKAKVVVHIFAQGAPSHVDTWDPKPMLAKYDGQAIPGSNGGVAMVFDFNRWGILVCETSSRTAVGGSRSCSGSSG